MPVRLAWYLAVRDRFRQRISAIITEPSAKTMKIYTKTGDAGQTGLFAGPRVSKDHARIDAYGTVDELNAVLGMVRTHCAEPTAGVEAGFFSLLDQLLASLQNELFDLGAELASPNPAETRVPRVGEAQVAALEQAIDTYDAELPPLKTFILPGGTRTAAALHVARTVCRRAERAVVHLANLPDEHVSPLAIAYLNRLSDLLFVLARAANAAAGRDDVQWQKRAD